MIKRSGPLPRIGMVPTHPRIALIVGSIVTNRRGDISPILTGHTPDILI